jgi:hypothetical protein
LRTDDDPVRTQSAILDKIKPQPFFFITMFSVRMRFLSVPKTWLARGARKDRYSHVTAMMTPYDYQFQG